jgi:hypothetical protein
MITKIDVHHSLLAPLIVRRSKVMSEFSSYVAETSGDDPLVAHLIKVYSAQQAAAMEATLDQIVTESSTDSTRQEALATLNCLHVIFNFLTSITDTALLSDTDIVTDSDSPQISSAFSNLATNNEDKQQQQLFEKCIWVLVRLSRRNMDKSTANAANISLIESYPQLLAVIVRICARFVKCVGIKLSLDVL